ncbi:sterile alpha motif domain-containing protein 1-like [Apodemus sylvaticus]|uniref:sterile alpha motif domain-containing protein 1-like n=1 Tax=Apodemus sylvaticus TaxID=10129 RepID=UPI00224450A0|nr:sterile alpha motif domain-containing protein 1-like [Apodemus sylvaticus]
MRAQERRCTSEPYWKDPAPRRPDHLRRRGRLACGPGPEPRSALTPAAEARLAATPSSLPGPSPWPRPARPGLSAAAPRSSGGRAFPLQAQPGPLSAPLPTPHALPGRALSGQLRQLERRAPHLLGKPQEKKLRY